MADRTWNFELPGFRFHPTEEELLAFYLKNTVHGKQMLFDVIGFLNIYHYDPRDLPALAKIDGEREWYFFVPRDRRHGNGGRPNRTTQHGFWKATGSDRKVVTLSEPKRFIGLKKTLVFYQGRAPRGVKTDWVMNEYRLPDNSPHTKDMVLCKVYRKATPLKVLELRAAMDEEMKSSNDGAHPTSSPLSSSYATPTSHCGSQQDFSMPMSHMAAKEEDHEVEQTVDQNTPASATTVNSSSTTCLKLPFGKDTLPDLHVPKFTADSAAQDSPWTWTHLLSSMSPWLESPSILNF